MSSTLSPAQRYRKYVREFFMLYVPPPHEPYDAHFHLYLQQMWRQMSQQLVTNGHPNAAASTRVGRYVIAVGLVTYGQLEFIPFMLRNIPIVGKMSRLAWVAFELLPLPEEVRSARDWEIVAKWVEEHVDQLEWDTEGEKFRRKERALVIPRPIRRTLVTA